MCITFAIPVYSYEKWFERTYGSFAETSSAGAFLYGRVSTFADCAIIKPPADERWLCLNQPPSERQAPDYYVWSASSPLKHGPGSEFSDTVNRLATDFDYRAILAQPLDYLKTVLLTSLTSFDSTNYTQTQYLFPANVPKSLQAIAASNDENIMDGYTYGREDPSTRLTAPFAGWVLVYQRFAVLPGWLLAMILLTGLTGMAAVWRRLGGPTLLPWLTGVVLLVIPAATAGFSSRYVVASIPVFCIAATLGGKQIADYFRAKADEVHRPANAGGNPL